jgi:cell division GTPase FtsZ
MVRFTDQTKVRLVFENPDESIIVSSSSLRDFCAVMENCGDLFFAVAEGKGETRGLDAVQDLVENFKTQSVLAGKAEDLLAAASGGHHNLEIKGKKQIGSLKEAKKMLFTVSSGECPSVKEINIIMHELIKRTNDKAQIFYNGAQDQKLGDTLQIAVIASDK